MASPKFATTNSTGEFSFADIANGHYNLRVSAPSYAPAEVSKVEIIGPPAQTSSQSRSEEVPTDSPPTNRHHPLDQRTFHLGTVALSPGALIKGQVETAQGRAIDGARVRLSINRRRTLQGLEESESFSTSTDNSGRFEFSSLAHHQTYVLSVEKTAFLERSLSAGTPQKEELTVKLYRGVDLQVTVTDENGRPIDAAGVRAGPVPAQPSEEATSPTPPRRMGRTASNGRLTLKMLGKGTWNLFTGAPGYLRKEVNDIAIDPDIPPKPIEVHLIRGVTLTGTITGPNDQPIAHASISSRNTGSPNQPHGNAGSKANGTYKIEGLATGNATFKFKAKGYRSVLRDVRITEGANHLDVRLEQAAKISGVVLGLDGEPVSGAMVSAQPLSRSSFLFFSGNGKRTDSEGAFTLDGLEPDRYQVAASKSGLPPASLEEPVLVQDTDIAGIVLRFEEGSTVQGTIVGLSLDELSQTEIFAGPKNRQNISVVGEPDYEGNYILENLGSGSWSILARSGSRSKRKLITIDRGGSEVELNFEFGGGYNLTGQVLRGGLPVPSIHVSASNIETRASKRATTDQDGRFEISDQEAGTYRVAAMRQRGILAEEEVELKSDLDIVLELSELTLKVRVLDKATGAPVDSARVSLATPDRRGFLRALTFSNSPGSDGIFTLTAIPHGEHKLSVIANGYSPTSTQVVIGEGAGSPVREVVLTPAVSFTLILTNLEGQALRAATITAIADTTSTDSQTGQFTPGLTNILFSQYVQPSAAGRVELNNAKPGTFTFLLSDSSGTTVRRRLTVPEPGTENEEPVHIQIPAGGSIRVEVLTLLGTRRMASLSLIDSANTPYVNANTSNSHTAFIDGRITVDGIAPGTYTLLVTAGKPESDSVDRWEQTVQIFSYQTTSVTMN